MNKEIGPSFVLAELGPAIHAFECPKQRRGCADQVRTRRLGLIPASLHPIIPRIGGNDETRVDPSGSTAVGLLTPVLAR
jgi:hypothetical protein